MFLIYAVQISIKFHVKSRLGILAYYEECRKGSTSGNCSVCWHPWPEGYCNQDSQRTIMGLRKSTFVNWGNVGRGIPGGEHISIQ